MKKISNSLGIFVCPVGTKDKFLVKKKLKISWLKNKIPKRVKIIKEKAAFFFGNTIKNATNIKALAFAKKKVNINNEFLNRENHPDLNEV
tara:strand:+ start:63 stop:332 length:270 start_codon:yes stop_codon:yes gene_type:complete